MDSDFHKLVSEQEPNICQIVCYKDGVETYSDVWNGYNEDDAVHIMSATKSIVAILIGICLDKGLIGSIDDKILDYFPDYKVKRGEKTIYEVTIRHMMTMKAPLKCKCDPWTKVCTSDDWSLTSLDFIGGRKGMTDEFRYNTVCLHVLTGIIAKASGMTPAEFANKYLFEPLGIQKCENFLAETAEEHKEFTMAKTPKNHVWFCDPLNIGTAGYGLCLSARDLAKIGQMCVNGGLYSGIRVVSEEWIAQMRKPTCKCGDEFAGMTYGMLWWIIDEDKGIYAAVGNSGNVIYVNGSNNFVAGVTSYFKPRVFDRVDFIQKYLDK